MKIIYNKYVPFKGFAAINLLGRIYARKESQPLSKSVINHELIHTQQQKELLFVLFYVWYGIEWLLRWICYGFNSNKAYKNIMFEREAYKNDSNSDYLKNRKLFSWLTEK